MPPLLLWLVACASSPSARGSVQENPTAESISIPETTVKFDMVHLPGGKFRMGSPEGEAGRDKDEGPVREVELQPFWIGRHEVTADAFEIYWTNRLLTKKDGITRPSLPHEYPYGEMGVAHHPALNMRWHGAVGYCEWLSRKTGMKFRLPTEAEWEYACRAGSAAPEPLGEHAWCKDNSQEKTHPVGQKKANAFGLHDMLGNVWEYCLEPCIPPEHNPVLRGGSWASPASDLRPANRQTIPEQWYYRDPDRPQSFWWLTDAPFVGFRVVRVPNQGDGKDEEAYAAKIEVGDLKLTRPTGKDLKLPARVTGEVVNRGERTLQELELLLYWLDGKERPVFTVGALRATFVKCYPVLVNSHHEGDHRRPLKPNERRKFEVDIPQPFDQEKLHPYDKVGAKATAVTFSR